jgi:hypothetical protein
MYIPRAAEHQKEKEHIKTIYCPVCMKNEAFVELREFDYLAPERRSIFERGILAYYFEEHGIDFLKLLLYLPGTHNKIEFLEIIELINSGTDLTSLQNNSLLLKKIIVSIKERNHNLYCKIVKFVSSRAIFIKIV